MVSPRDATFRLLPLPLASSMHRGVARFLRWSEPVIPTFRLLPLPLASSVHRGVARFLRWSEPEIPPLPVQLRGHVLRTRPSMTRLLEGFANSPTRTTYVNFAGFLQSLPRATCPNRSPKLSGGGPSRGRWRALRPPDPRRPRYPLPLSLPLSLNIFSFKESIIVPSFLRNAFLPYLFYMFDFFKLAFIPS